MEVAPSHYGLSSRVQLEEIGKNHLGLRKVIKSRIIQKDAAKIVETVRQIRGVVPGVEITLICTRNICSKSLALLHENGVEVRYCEE